MSKVIKECYVYGDAVSGPLFTAVDVNDGTPSHTVLDFPFHYELDDAKTAKLTSSYKLTDKEKLYKLTMTIEEVEE